jgi:hypothetical protein
MSVILGAPSATQNGGALSIQTANATAATKSSGAVSVVSGNGLTTGTSGAINIKSGTSGSGATGAINVSTGTTSGTQGDINLTSRYTNINSTIYGDATIATRYGNFGGGLNIFSQYNNTGNYYGFIKIKSGNGDYLAGDIDIVGGNVSTTLGSGVIAGSIYLTGGDGDYPGNINISAGNNNNPAHTLSGNVNINAGIGGYAGNINIQSGGSVSGASGGIYLIAGSWNVNMYCQDASGFINIGNYDTFSTISANSTQLGFFNATPVAQPTVTGSRATGAALQNLLTQLANLGLIIDSTTV